MFTAVLSGGVHDPLSVDVLFVHMPLCRVVNRVTVVTP